MHLREFLADLDKIGPLGKVTGWMDGGWVGVLGVLFMSPASLPPDLKVLGQ